MPATTIEFELPDAEATLALGERLGQLVPPGTVLSLLGELGAGKTTLVRGLAAGLGIDPDEVSSPTYTLMHQHQGRLELHHLDAWMGDREGAFLASGGVEWLHGSGVAAVEWAERVAAYLPVPRLELRLWPTPQGARRARLSLVTGPTGGVSAAGGDPIGVAARDGPGAGRADPSAFGPGPAAPPALEASLRALLGALGAQP